MWQLYSMVFRLLCFLLTLHWRNSTHYGLFQWYFGPRATPVATFTEFNRHSTILKTPIMAGYSFWFGPVTACHRLASGRAIDWTILLEFWVRQRSSTILHIQLYPFVTDRTIRNCANKNVPLYCIQYFYSIFPPKTEWFLRTFNNISN